MASAQGGARRRLLSSSGDASPFYPRPHRALVVGLLALLACPALANQLQVTPSLSVAETYTDNVSLAPDALRQSEWVTEVIPGISIVASGARLRFNVNYAPVLLYYADRGEDNLLQRGNATGNLELLSQLLFVDAGARIDQYDVSLRGPLTTSNVNTTGNRSTTKTSYASPYLRHEFGAEASAEARLTYSTWRADDQNTLPDNDATRADLRLKSGPTNKRVAWGIDYAQESIKYETQQEMTSEILTANGRLSIARTFGLLALAGYESYDSGIVNEVQEGARWSIGLEWTPTPRTRIAGMAGRRFDDEAAYDFELRHRTRLTTWSASYKEDVTTSRSQFFVPATADTAASLDRLFVDKFPDPAVRQKAIEEFLARTGLPPSLSSPVNFYTDQFFVQKRWLASVGLLGVRNNLLANLFRETRTPLFSSASLPASGDFVASNSIRTSGGSLAWSWRVTARSTWNLDAGYTRNVFLDTNQVDDFTYVRAGLTRQMLTRLSASLYYRVQDNDSTVNSARYRENAVVAAMRMTF